MHWVLNKFFGNGRNLYRIFIFCQLILCSCSGEERKKAEVFLKRLFLEEGGVYTLLGDKPITDVLIYTGSEQDNSLEGLSIESLENIEFVEDNIVENWNSWKNFSKNLEFKNYRFIERPSFYDPLHIIYLFVNVEKMKELLHQYKDVFSIETGIDFSVEQVVNELGDPGSVFWNKVFLNHYLSGLLHGYGEENSQYFVNEKTRIYFSEKFEGKITQDNFPIPVFAVATAHENMTEKYKKQREEIKNIYRNQNFFKTSLEFLKQESSKAKERKYEFLVNASRVCAEFISNLRANPSMWGETKEEGHDCATTG